MARSDRQSPPSANINATSNNTRPGAWRLGARQIGAMAATSPAVKPTASATSAKRRVPQCAAIPPPSAVTTSLGRRLLPFTRQGPLWCVICGVENQQFPAPEGLFRGSTPTQTPPDDERSGLSGEPQRLPVWPGPPFPPVSSMGQSSPASRSYVLASLRALHLDPASGPAQSRDQEGKAGCDEPIALSDNSHEPIARRDRTQPSPSTPARRSRIPSHSPLAPPYAWAVGHHLEARGSCRAM